MEVDEGLGHKFTIVVGGSLERNQRVDVYSADFQTIRTVVERIDCTASAKRVLLVAAITRPGLWKAKGDSDSGLEGSIGKGEAKEVAEVANVADESLKGAGALWRI